jgi:hypothetical protein
VHVRSHIVSCRSVDLAEGGLRAVGAWCPQPGEYARVRLNLSGQEIAVEGRVAWRERTPGGAQWGLAFTSVGNGARDVIRGYIDGVHEDARPPVSAPPASAVLPDDDDSIPFSKTRVAPAGWENPPTNQFSGEAIDAMDSASRAAVLDTLPGGGSEGGDLPDPDGPEAPEPPPARPARRPRVRHRVTMHDLWMMQVQQWRRKNSEGD